ncbi:MAG: Hsp20/alpha crystallin family protein [Nitrospirae bacterium]|nr:Hsp20/alpha crystallin family protein [Nitrospirota bacterium]
MALLVRREPGRALGDVRQWEPFRELRTIHDEMDRFFASLWPRTAEYEAGVGPAAWVPALDVHEEKDGYVIKAELPGVKREDVSLSLEDDVLTIKGERRDEKEEKREGFLRRERVYGTFQRALQLPQSVKGDAVNAEFKDGILKITLPKADTAKTREIKIDVK